MKLAILSSGLSMRSTLLLSEAVSSEAAICGISISHEHHMHIPAAQPSAIRNRSEGIYRCMHTCWAKPLESQTLYILQLSCR